MALAGNMKLKHFLALVGGVVLLGGAALVVGTWTLCSALPDPVEVVEPPPPATVRAVEQPTVAEPAVPIVAPEAPVPEPPAPPAVPTDPARPWDDFLLERQGEALGVPKIKDASKGRSWKVNLYQDEGHAVVNRAKVDIDRDDRWDEKWTFEADGLTRKVAPADDEAYTETWRWTGGGWTQE